MRTKALLVAVVTLAAPISVFAGASGLRGLNAVAGLRGLNAVASADVTEVSGDAFGHYTYVGLFGGPQSAVGPAPRVALPPAGADPALTANEASASAVYGPAKIFGGIWPPKAAVAPASGPITVTTKGKPGRGASVTSTASIVLHPKPMPVQCDGEAPGTLNCTAPGGFGPEPVTQGDELHSTCTATESGATGSARFVNAVLATSTDESGEPKDEEPVPNNPPPNYTRTGQITNVGDNWRIVFNEQIVDPDGSITVNAVHMFLLGPIAVGEQILGHVRCSMHGASSSPTTSIPGGPTASTTPDSALPTEATPAKSGTNVLPFVLAAVAVVAIVVLLSVRRRGTRDHGP